MDEVLQANIFFFITGIAVIVFTFLGSIVLYHVIRLLKSVRRIAERIEAGSEAVANDLEQVRTYITEQSFLSRVFSGAPTDANDEPEKAPRARTVTPKKVTRAKSKTELKIRGEE